MSVAQAVRGHLWTVAPLIERRVKKLTASEASVPWQTEVRDALRGTVTLTGRFHDTGERDTLVIVVHGLGGTVDSHYVQSASRALTERRLSHLRVHLRGADRSGADYYHAGLTDDLEAIFASDVVRSFDKVFLWGNSLGGHVSLRFAAVSAPPSLKGVIAVCPPLDLSRGADAIDHWSRRPYLNYVLGGLVEIYERVAAKAEVPVSVARAKAIRSIRAWDEEIIAPRFGFEGAEDYYRRVGVGSVLSQIAVPTMVVVGDADPMIPVHLARPVLARASAAVDARFVDGGHMGFAPRLSLGEGGALGLDAQLCRWVERHK